MAGKNIFVIQLVHINSAVWTSLSRKECRSFVGLQDFCYSTIKDNYTTKLYWNDLGIQPELYGHQISIPTKKIPYHRQHHCRFWLRLVVLVHHQKRKFKKWKSYSKWRETLWDWARLFPRSLLSWIYRIFSLEMFLNCDWNAAQFCTINSAQLPPFLLCKCHCFLFRGSRFCHPRKKRLFCEMESF